MGVKKKHGAAAGGAVSYFQIYKYGKWYEVLATLLGVVLGMLSGGGVCYNLAQFGEVTTAFVDRTSNQHEMSSYLPLTALFGGGRRLVNASYEENMAALVEDARAMCAGTFVAIIISLVLCNASVALLSWSAARQITRIRMLFLEAVMRQDMAWFDMDTDFNLASKMSENMVKLKDGMGDRLGVIANLVGTAILCVCESLSIGWQLTLACITVIPFAVATSIILSNYQTTSMEREMNAYSQAGKQAEEILKSVRTVIAFGGEAVESDRYLRLLQPAERCGRRRGFFTGVGTGIHWLFTYGMDAICLSYGTRLILGDLDKPTDQKKYIVGVLFSILFNVYMATQSVTFCAPLAEIFAAAKGAAVSVFQLVDRRPPIDCLAAEGATPQKLTGDLKLEGIHFSYPSRPDVKVLQGFSLHVKAGECVALVGSSGCGKSTILQLLQRLYDPHMGTVKLDGMNVKDLNLGWLRSRLGVVGQEPVLFRGTIYENITIGVAGASREDVQRAAEMAYAHDFITRLPKGYETVIGERGASLSGGQKQRIAIARSMLRAPAVLLLDEATSALDPHSEREVQAALDRASAGRTTLMVSHRLSTIVNADRIVCMDRGAIVEQGTHKELLKAKGFYHKLVTAGSESKEPDVIETVLEETGDLERPDAGDAALNSSADAKRRSNRRLARHSLKQESQEWMTPRSSVSSVMSTAFQKLSYNAARELKQEMEEEEVRPVSDWQILKLNKEEWPYVAVGAAAAVVQGACFPVIAWLVGDAAGIFVLSDQGEILYRANLYSGMCVLVGVVAAVAMFLQNATFTHSGLKLTTRLRYQYFSAMLRQEAGFFDKESNTVGAVCARLSGDAAEVQSATGLRIGLILQGVSSVVVGFIMAFCYDWKLTLVGIAILPVMFGSIFLERIVSQKSERDERAAMETATAVATEAIVSIKTVQSLGVENIFLKRFEKALLEAHAAVAPGGWWRGLVLGLDIYVPFMIFSSVMVYGAVLVAREGLQYKKVMLVNGALMYGAYMLGQALVMAPGFASAKTCCARILSVIHREPKVKTEDGVEDRKDWAATGNFSLKGVEFSYPTRPNQKILKGIDLKVDAGKTVALVGSSGCGKSTILQLMQRFYDPTSGNIELDGRDTRAALTLPRLRQQLGVVQQEPVLFNRTLAENIAYGDNSRKVSMHEIVASAKAADIHNFIISLPQGYETNLGASGAQLSGGQKQRVCIARALVRSPRLLLLDEATSALDANSEKAVSQALEKAAMGRTCITVAHRLSTIKDSDIICVLNKGKIIERGSHAELVALRGAYWQMCRGQQMA